MAEGSPSIALKRSAYDAVVFDLDGVVTRTAEVHARAWKKMFDEYFGRRSKKGNKSNKPFDIKEDYRRYVDGKSRYEGVKSFLSSRKIILPQGSPDDKPGKETVCGLGNRKNEFFLKKLEEDGIESYSHALELIRKLRSTGFKAAVVSSSRNCSAVLEAAGISVLFDIKVDGGDVHELNLNGKPAPDIFLEAVRRITVKPERAVILEDSIAGVEAGKRGKFGLVIGVNRGQENPLFKEKGADEVVADLSEIKVKNGSSFSKNIRPLPSALDRLNEISNRVNEKKVAVFLDYDGTLTPIVDKPDRALISSSMRNIVRGLADYCKVAIISGRDLSDVRRLVGVRNIIYAGSHGFDISGPEGHRLESQQGGEFLPSLDDAEKELREKLKNIPGHLVERKRFSVAVHYRKVKEEKAESVENIVDRVLSDHSDLRKGYGKKVFEVQPRIDWNKGKALIWLVEALDLDWSDLLCLYIGDDITDEDAFKALSNRGGIGILVAEEPRPTAAGYRLKNPGEVEDFLSNLTHILEGGNKWRSGH